jgi:hypothetical protein
MTNEKIRVLMPSQVANLHEDIDIRGIQNELNAYILGLASKINLSDLGDWRLLISIVLRPTNAIGVFKKAKRFPSDKEIEISISIPIPDNSQVEYGLSTAKDSFYRPVDLTNFFIIEPNYSDYRNLYDYILESSKKSITLAFSTGYTANGKKIKFH